MTFLHHSSHSFT